MFSKLGVSMSLIVEHIYHETESFERDNEVSGRTRAKLDDFLSVVF